MMNNNQNDTGKSTGDHSSGAFSGGVGFGNDLTALREKQTQKIDSAVWDGNPATGKHLH